VKKASDLCIDLAASGLKVGYIPVASGTFGTLIAVPFVVLSRIYFSELLYFFITLLVLIISIFIADRAEKIYKEKDSSKIVIDEIAGYFTACLFLPSTHWDFFVMAFFIFRFFDIVKLWPANYFDKKEGGLSIVLDDFFAGAYTLLILQIYFFLRVVFLVAIGVGG